MLAFIAEYQATIIGLIWMIVLGPAVGNYACSVVYRLPKGQTPFERHPYCGSCNTSLKPIDLFPILSFCLTRGKCRYCSAPIPSIYTAIEVACLVLFVANFLLCGMGEQFLLLTAAGVFAIILAAIQWQQGWLSVSVYCYTLTCLLVESVRVEDSIFPFVHTLIVSAVGLLVIERLRSAMLRKPFAPFAANWLWWGVLLAVTIDLLS